MNARIIAQGISGPLGQQVIVENRPTTVLPDAVARAAPDGHTLMLYSGGLWIQPFLSSVNYDPIRDFAPIAFVARSPLILVVHPSLPVHSVRDLIALARAKPGTLNYTTGGTGSASHLGPELFKQMAMGLLDGTITPRMMETGRYKDADVLDLMSRCTIELPDEFAALAPQTRCCRLTATLKNGETRVVEYRRSLQDDAADSGWKHAVQKFGGLTAGLLDSAAQEKLISLVAGLENERDVASLVALTALKR